MLTRDSDGGLYDEQSNNKKVQDLQRRCELIHKTSPRCRQYSSEQLHHTGGKRCTGILLYEFCRGEEVGGRVADGIGRRRGP